MPVPYRNDIMLGPAELADPGTIDLINTALGDAGLTATVRNPVTRRPGRTVVEVAGADPRAVQAALDRARAGGARIPELTPDLLYRVDTRHEPDRAVPAVWYAHGKRVGHTAGSWLPAPGYAMPTWDAWEPAGPAPVVALLDSGVEGHTRLPGPASDPPFVLDATTLDGWRLPVDVPTWEQERDSGDGSTFGPYFGHGTFVAGIIRELASAARVLSIPLMSDGGNVSIENVAYALEWLAGNHDQLGVTVVLMAFGCVPDDDDPPSVAAAQAEVEKMLTTLNDRGLPVVISAGNDGTDEPAYPAAYAAELEHVVCVGSRTSSTIRAPYSNHGVWVQRWREGSDVVGVMPLRATRGSVEADTDTFAWWSGTSFAAARYAAELAAGGSAPPRR